MSDEGGEVHKAVGETNADDEEEVDSRIALQALAAYTDSVELERKRREANFVDVSIRYAKERRIIYEARVTPPPR